MAEEKTGANALKEKAAVKSLQDVFSGYQDKAKKSKTGVHEIDITKSYSVVFTADFRGFKKGQPLSGISEVMKDLYVSNGVAKVTTKEIAEETTEE